MCSRAKSSKTASKVTCHKKAAPLTEAQMVILLAREIVCSTSVCPVYNSHQPGTQSRDHLSMHIIFLLGNITIWSFSQWVHIFTKKRLQRRELNSGQLSSVPVLTFRFEPECLSGSNHNATLDTYNDVQFEPERQCHSGWRSGSNAGTLLLCVFNFLQDAILTHLY